MKPGTRRVAALLRGVNLGKRQLKSADLKRVAEACGFAEVRTLLTSGNVVFASERAGAEIERALEEALAAEGLVTDVIVRDLTQLEAAIAANPFPAAAADHPSHLLVTFHRDPVPADLTQRVAAIHDGPERLAAIGRELFTDFGGRTGMAQSKLLAAFRKVKAPTIATGRNWNTVTKLAAMLAGHTTG